MSGKPITKEIATAKNDITQSYVGRVLSNPDKVLSSEGRGEGLGLYEIVERDSHVYSVMQTRKLAVTGKEWNIEPASDDARDREIADFVEQVFKEVSFDQACGELLDGTLKGFKPVEITWDYSEGQIWIRKFLGRDPRRFTFGLDNKLRLLTWTSMIEGEEVPEYKFQVFRFGSKNDNPYGIGLGQKLYWPVWFKKNGIKFWIMFAEKFGMPTIWGKYPTGTTKEKQDDLLDALKAIQTDTAIITPDTMLVELLEASRTSSIDTYENLCRFMDDQISKVVLGQTATVQGTPGKLGNEDAQENVRRDIVKADADLLCECFNTQSIRWLVDYNFPNVKKYPKLWKRAVPEKDLLPLAQRDQILVKDIGLPVSTKYFYDTYGIPDPEPDEELVIVPAMPAPFAPAAPGFSERTSKGNNLESKRSRLEEKYFPTAHFKSSDFIIFNEGGQGSAFVRNRLRRMGSRPKRRKTRPR